jgi:ribosomal protein L19
MSIRFLHTLPNYLSILKNITFKDCAFNDLRNQDDNLFINMSSLNLNKISIDIDNLQVILGNGKRLYYLRKGQLQSNHQFAGNSSTSTTSLLKRKMGVSIVVLLTIHINTLQKIEIFTENSDD